MIDKHDKRAMEIAEMSQPLVRWLRENGHPHMSIVVTQTMVEVVEDVMGVPVDGEEADALERQRKIDDPA